MSLARVQRVRLKIERAKKHISDLETLISDFLSRDFYTLGTKQKPHISHVAYYVTSVDPLPEDIPLILGDALHNLRSTLDHLFWQLVEANGGTAGTTTQFPITKTVQQYNSAFGIREITQIRSKTPKAVDILRDVQPYRTTDDTLWHLHRLDIEDKHRLIIPVACASDSWGLKRENVWLGDLSGSFHIELGEELLNIPVNTHQKAGDNIKFGVDVTFRNSEIVGCKSVLETLHNMADSVETVIAQFEPFLTYMLVPKTLLPAVD
jgi:hypothetical protein